ncbi:hypothetical protein D9757_001580 [Collybiopsis confluens]|uniref:Major facilitator superfamily (MFS) profile domain-containing protein n=1 Tax=Collybiopsis confluens TaxID=2823264 RepID=A0A8H5HZN7_9AGAR|nr:hypothetical protein D9757_001580 [Collybiopsis confluens]
MTEEMNLEEKEQTQNLTGSSTQLNTTSGEASATCDYPAGKTKAWLTVLGCFLVQFSTVASLNAFGAFEDFYASTFLPSSSASRISWIVGLALLLELGLGIVGGKLDDLGYTRATLTTGSVIYILLHALSRKGRSILSSHSCPRTGHGNRYWAVIRRALVTVARHFPHRQALVMGIVMSSGSWGGAIFSIMLNHLIPKYGFASGVRDTAYFALGLLFTGNLLITVPPRSQESESDVPIGQTNLLYVPYILTIASGVIGQLGAFFPLSYIQLFADNHHMAKGFVFYSLAAMTFSTGFGRLIPAYFADKHGVAGTYIICGFMLAGCAFIMFAASHPGGLFVFCIFYGFFYGGTTSLYPSVVTALVPSEIDKGKLVGVAIAPIGISALISSPISGKIVGNSEDYQWWKGIVWTGSLLVAAGIIQLIGWVIHNKKMRSVST